MALRKVSMFGWYMHGNFGDDVMAVMIARTLKMHGFRPVVYRLPKYLAEEEGIEVADTFEELMDGAAACILGGGGLLVLGEQAMTRKFRLLDEDLMELTRLAAARSVPVWGVSLGGTGGGRFSRVSPGLARLLGSGVVHGMTLRLKGDQPLVAAFGISSECYPDMVFSVPDFWPGDTAGANKDIVATNRIAHLWGGRCLIGFLDRCGPLALGLAPRHVNARHILSAQDRWSRMVGRRQYQVEYTNIADVAAVLSRARAIISTKLHIGIFAMSYGAAFYSYYGTEKTRAQLRELGLDARILRTRDLPMWVARLRTDAKRDVEATRQLVAELKCQARGHLRSMLSFLERLP